MYDQILHILSKGGYVMVPIFLVSQVGWYFVVERFFYFRKLGFSQGHFWKALQSGSLPSEESARQTKSAGLFGIALDRILSRRPNGEKAMVRAAEEVFSEHIPGMQRHLSTIAAMAGSAPLLGLLGTVSGMVTTFKVITRYGIGNPAMMAEGISEALLTTQAGLIVGFPLLLMHNYLLNRADRIESECIGGAARIINLLR